MPVLAPNVAEMSWRKRATQTQKDPYHGSEMLNLNEGQVGCRES